MSSAFETLVPEYVVMHSSKESGGLSQLDSVLSQARLRATSDEFVVMHERFYNGVEMITLTLGTPHQPEPPAVESLGINPEAPTVDVAHEPEPVQAALEASGDAAPQ